MGEVVFKEGDQSNSKFYIILSGEAAVIKEETTKNKKKKLNKTPKTCWLNSLDLSSSPMGKSLLGNNSLEHLDTEIMSSPKAKPVSHGFFHMRGSLPNFQIKATETRKENSVSLEIIEENGLKVTEGEIIQEEQYDQEKFEEYAQKYGKVIRYIGEGDSFGELALKSDEPRSASIFCKTDCEFLVMTKQQFELIFAKKEKEKEELLASVFPFYYKAVTYADKNFFLYSFKVYKNISLNFFLIFINRLRLAIKEII